MQRAAIIHFLKNCSGAGTMLDPRRYTDYDATDSVSRYLNLAPVKVASVAEAVPAEPIWAVSQRTGRICEAVSDRCHTRPLLDPRRMPPTRCPVTSTWRLSRYSL